MTRLTPSTGRNRLTVVLLTVWVLSLVSGWSILMAYESRPGFGVRSSGGHAPPQLAAVGIPKLVVFLHPRCPCSSATVEELNRLVALCPGQFRIEAVIYEPTDESASWTDTQLVRDIRAIPGTTIRFDRDAALTRQMGAVTSGQVLFYDREGKLKFKGGITPSRGHAGDNDGVDAIVSIIHATGTSTDLVTNTPVFGCSIYRCENPSLTNP